VGKGTAIENNARVKSGVIQGVRSYSGYVRDKNGRTIVYSMIANNFNGSGSNISRVHRELITDLANLK
jgi:D-alanyl-D-alanine carboxypeptidase/D-alanyl-D-alanine-endopeptidase (penicillin-binding protein 4)